MPLLEAKEIVFSYPNGVQALNGVNLAIEAGQTVAIVGRNGSGKTTLVKHFNGLLTPQSGSIFVDGQPILGREPADLAPIVGLVFQNPNDQIFQGRVDEEVAFGVRQLGLPKDAVDKRVAKALAEVELSRFAEVHPYDLTLTERKLVCLASILAMEPKIIILDEPTTAQDQLGVLGLIEIIRRLKSEGQTIVTITHDMEFVAEAFERTVVMREGKIILDGTTAEVFQKPEVLETTYVKPSAISRLTQRLHLPPEIITFHAMSDYIAELHHAQPAD